MKVFYICLMILFNVSLYAVEPVNPNATKKTRQVLNYLYALSAEERAKVISGQHMAHKVQNTQYGYDKYVKALHDSTGSWLGMISTDYGNDADPSSISSTNQILIDYWKKGGLISLDMHPDNPWTGGTCWDLTDRNLLEIITPGTAVNQTWENYLDILAAGFLELQDSGVVVLWRPYHEMSYRSSFWWDMGAVLDDHPDQGEAVWKDFWKHLFNYFTYTKGINNLLWVYAPANTDGYGGQWNDVERVYPGDDYVDVVGIDCYGDVPAIIGQGYEKMIATGKPFAFTECGPNTRDGSYDNTLFIQTVRDNYPLTVYCNFWHSWTNNKVAIVDNKKANELMNDSWIVTRDEISWQWMKTDLILSEYIEGSNNNKALEIYNGTGASVDLSDYEVWLISDGGSWAEDTLKLAGELGYRDVYVLSNPSADSSVKAVSDSLTSFACWDGNDAIGLAKNKNNSTVLIDVIGEEGSAPASGWDVAGVANATKDHTLVRKLSVAYENTNWNSSSGTNSTDSEWLLFDQDTFYNLGFYGPAWTGLANSDWDDAGNWSTATVPTKNDDVVILPDRTNFPEIFTGANAIVRSLTVKPCAHITVPSGKSLSVKYDLTLESSPAGNASLIDNGALTYDTTKSSCQTYLTEDTWHLISSPVKNAQSGVCLGIYLGYFMETDSTWHDITSLHHDLTPGQGFTAWAESSLTGDTTVTFTGPFNKGNITPPSLTYTPGMGTGDGWNLLGNPYPSALEWNGNWQRTNVDATVYVYSSTDGQYYNWNATLGNGTMGDGEIPPGQGFWVKANAPGPAITIPDGERVHTSKNFYKSSGEKSNTLLVKVSGNGYADRMIVGFDDEATDTFDTEYDAYKIPGIAMAPQMYAVEGEYRLSMDIRPLNETVIVPVDFIAGSEEVYIITAEHTESFEEETEIYLEDVGTGEVIDLKSNEVYEFTASPSDDPGRFVLHFGFESFIEEEGASDRDADIYATGKDVSVAVPDGFTGNIEVYDVMSRLIIRKKAVGGTLNIVKVNQGTGIYVVRLINSVETYSKKVFIQ